MRILTAFFALVLVSCSAAKPEIQLSGVGTAFIDSGEKGNGADTGIDSVAWFTKESFVPQACYEIDPGFGASEETVKRAITEAEIAWHNYVVEKQIHVPIRMLQSWYIQKCRGNEELVYYFGSKPKEVQDALGHFNRPVAIAYRTAFDVEAGTSKGFIWVASQGSLSTGAALYPDWSQRYNLTGILMHELGHVYGVDHVALTIMDMRIADFLSLPDSERKERLSGVDSYRDLYICLECPLSKAGELGFDSPVNFTNLLGQAPVGPVLARVEGTVAGGNLSLHVEDFAGSYVIPIDVPKKEDIDDLNSMAETEGIFRVHRVDENGHVVTTQIDRGSRVVYASLRTKSGETLPLIIEMNMSTTVHLASGKTVVDGLVIKTFEKGIPKVLFHAVAYQP
ncbi:MAG: hypothetical protein V4760_11220 [Bdellovibrionota bacterium]